jgi:hypothetical protein
MAKDSAIGSPTVRVSRAALERVALRAGSGNSVFKMFDSLRDPFFREQRFGDLLGLFQDANTEALLKPHEGT